MIREINSEQYVRFLNGNNANKKQVSINGNGTHYGYFVDDKLVGVISTNETKNTIRIKGFLVNDAYLGKGIGTKLLESLIDDTKTMTAFSTTYSRGLFLKCGFEVETLKDNGIAFLKRQAKSSRVLKEEIKEKLKPSLVEMAKVILFLDKKDLALAKEYIKKELNKL